MRILITGARGMVGSDLVRLAKERGHDVVAAGRGDLDITQQEGVYAYVRALKPDCIINAAGYNLVDAAETPEGRVLAQTINADGPLYLAQAAEALDIPFVHMSTDYVFGGTKHEGYREDDIPDPVDSVYAKTKLAGEEGALRAHRKTYIVRTTKIFGKKGDSPNTKGSFVSLMLRLAAEKPELHVVDEQIGCPTYSPDLAQAILELVEQGYPFGIYHIINSGEPVTPYGWAQEIFSAAGIAPKVQAVDASYFPSNAPRPKFAALLNTKFPALRPRGQALQEFLANEQGLI